MRLFFFMPRAFFNGREIESYSYNDRQVQHIARFCVLTGATVGSIITAAAVTFFGG